MGSIRQGSIRGGAADMSQLSNQDVVPGANEFTGDISKWDVSSVPHMQYMFSGASSFNGDLSKWDVSSVAAKSESKTRQILTGVIQITAWDPDTPYMTKLKRAGGSHCASTCEGCDRLTCVPAAYEMYQALRDQYASSPAFFLDVATWFYGEPGGAAIGRRVLSSILELDLDNPALLRVVAYRLLQARVTVTRDGTAPPPSLHLTRPPSSPHPTPPPHLTRPHPHPHIDRPGTLTSPSASWRTC